MAKLADIRWAEAVPPTSLEVIRQFERKLGITFPDDYKSFAQKYAGGRPRSFSDFDLSWTERFSTRPWVSSYPFKSLVIGRKRKRSRGCMEHVNGLPERFVPITSGGGSDCVGYDFRYTPPKVAFWMFGVDEPDVIADSFTEFVDMLYDETTGRHE